MEKPITEHIKKDGSYLDLKSYEKVGGYSGIRKMFKEFKPLDVQETVKESGLKGRGGAGFSTGMKWSFVPMGKDAPKQKYFCCNADEMEPGTFKDRLIMEKNPHLLIEGIIASCYAIEAPTGFIFLRGEYVKAAEILNNCIVEAYEANYLGKNILGSGFDMDLKVHTSVGRYMCGEETGLLNALEGTRAMPRAKPPYPQTSGLYGKPTVVNNVETIANVPLIIKNGADWFKDISKTGEGGTKLYGVSGNVKNPGTWELPLGTTLGEVIMEYAGGMKDGFKFRGVIPGGGSTDFMLEEHFDVNMDFSTPPKYGSRLGTGTMIVLDDKTCPVGFVQNLEHFFALESCGWCTPCREGLPWIDKTLIALEEGRGKMEDIDILLHHTKYITPGNTFCALAPGAIEPLQSALKYFREDFEKHIKEKHCPWRD
jgi:NADH-quinone oxidoreductase subunit F